MTNSKLLSKAREARRAKKAASKSVPCEGNDIDCQTRLEVSSSFVPTSSSSSSSKNYDTNDYTQGKTLMTFDDLKASGALTPVKKQRPASSSSVTSTQAKQTNNRPRSSPAPSNNTTSRISVDDTTPPPFASPTTGRTQKAASKLAARRSTSKSGGTSTSSMAELGEDFGGEKEEDSDKASKLFPRNNRAAASGGAAASVTTASFASPPLSGTSRFTSRPTSSSGGTTKCDDKKQKQGTSRRSIADTAITPEGRTPLKQLPLSVQREMERKREARMKSSDTDPNFESRRNLDKRTARLRFSHDFAADLAKHHQLLSPTTYSTGSGTAAAPGGYEKNGVSVFVRKRPIFQYELDRGEFDVVAVDKTSSSASSSSQQDTVIISNCVMHPDMQRKLVKPSYFPCTKAFDEHCTQDDIYAHIAQPMVKNSARGGVSTILMFGQTGSGKTHTMTGIEQRAAQGIFDELVSCGNADEAIIAVQFVELSGKSCKDLLGDAGEEVTLAEDNDGSVRLLNAESIEVKSANDLAKAIELGKSRRATEATDVNGVSSRSHAVCQVQITFKGRKRRGLLNLLDLAGSERKNDSMYHSSVRQKESTEINASLWALKECTRTRALASAGSKKKSSNVVIPYRASNLTRLLRESFERDSARLCVIATVAPNATDTEHSMETLRFVSQLVGLEKNIKEGDSREVVPVVQRTIAKTELLPKTFTHAQLSSFLRKKKIRVDVSDTIDGKAIMKMSTQQIRSNLFAGDPRKAGVSADIFNALRKENDRVAKLQRAERLKVSKARKQGHGQ